MIIKDGKRIDGLGDSMPIGSIVEIAGTEIPDGWEEVLEPEDATVYIGPTEPTDGQDIWIQKSRNLFKGWNIGQHYGSSNGKLTLGTDGSSSDLIPVDFSNADNRYHFSNLPTNSNIYISAFDSKKVYVGRTASGIKEDYTFYPGRLQSGGAGSGDANDIKFIAVTYQGIDVTDNTMLNLGTEPLPYEPYVDKKIYIKNETGKYDLFVKNRVHVGIHQPTDNEEVWLRKGKNLSTTASKKVAGGGLRNFPVYVGNLQSSTTYTLSFTKTRIEGTTINNPALYPWHYVDLYSPRGDRVASFSCSSDRVANGFNSGSRNFSYTFRTPENCNCAIIYFDNNNGDTEYNTLVENIQIETGNIATGYEPYVDKSVLVRSNSNAYEEFIGFETGTWVPGIGALGEDAPTVEYTRQMATYCRIGKMVFIDFSIRGKITALNGTNNYATITGIPFVTCCTTAAGQNGLSIGCVYGLIGSNGYDNLTIAAGGGVNYLRLQCNTGASASTLIKTTSAYFDVSGSGWYRID